MLLLKRLLPAILIALALFGVMPDVARAQGCGQQNPNCIVATAPVGTSNNQAASTAFVQQNGGYINLSGDCTASAQGVITCTKSNGVLFGSMAFQNANAVAITGGSITGMPSPANPSDVATKNYVDSLAGGITVLAPSGLATAAVLPNTPTYANGTLGVGATLTAASNTTLTVDGTAAPLNTVVLVKNQASAFQNGIYSVTQAGSGSVPWILTRVTYLDQAAEMKAGSYTFTTGGATNAGSAYTLQTSVTTVGTDPLNWLLFTQGSGSISGAAVVIASRALAATENLSAYSVVQTLGYAAAGDGAGATFVKVSAGTPFTDQSIDTITTPPTLVGGSGYINAIYNGVSLSGGSSPAPYCSVQIVVSGGAVTAVNSAMPCPAYKVGDVLTASNSQIGGTGSGFSWTVRAINTAQGSFPDAPGNLFQIVTDQGSFPNILQFGGQGNWNGSDSGITNSRPAYISGVSYSMMTRSNITAGQFVNGNTFIIPKGAFLFCGGTQGATLPVPQGVTIKGAGRWGGTMLVQCATESAANHGGWICDPYAASGQFGCLVEDLVYYTAQSSSNNAVYTFASYSGQQFELLHNVGIVSGTHGCFMYDFGTGGAANAIFNGGECAQAQGVTNPGITIGSHTGGTMVLTRDWVVECGGTGCNRDAIVVNGTPYAVFQGNHSEANQGNSFNIGSTGGSVSIRDMSISAPPGGCAAAITAQPTNPVGSILMENIQTNCTLSFSNGRAGGNIAGGFLGQQVK